MVVSTKKSQNRLVDKPVESILFIVLFTYLYYTTIQDWEEKGILDPSDLLHRFLML